MSQDDSQRFHSKREELYDEVRKLVGFLPCMLHLGDELYKVSTRRAVKYVVEENLRRPLPVYLMFMVGSCSCPALNHNITRMLAIVWSNYRANWLIDLTFFIPGNDTLATPHDCIPHSSGACLRGSIQRVLVRISR